MNGLPRMQADLVDAVRNYVAQFDKRPAIRLGDAVRVFFGVEHRDGVVEHIRDDDYALVRISPGWLHAERLSRLLPLKEGRVAA